MDKETHNKFRLSIEVDYLAEKYDGDPEDLYEVASMEKESIINALVDPIDEILEYVDADYSKISIKPLFS